jgi:uncharacterized protein YndB with AHSA1/START domain
MEHVVERDMTVPEPPEEVWHSLAEGDWLGDDAAIELTPGGEVKVGERSGFVEELDPPRRLAFWRGEPGGESTRVEVELEELDAGTRVRVVESRPLAVLDVRGVEAIVSAPPSFGPQALAMR